MNLIYYQDTCFVTIEEEPVFYNPCHNFIHRCNVSFCSTSCALAPLTERVVSSAYISIIPLLVQFGMLLTYIENRSEPRMEP